MSEREQKRDEAGRFASIYSTPENRCYRRMAALRQAIVDTVRPEDIVKVLEVMVERAKAGSETAAKLVLQYGVGKPARMADPDRVDHDEWQLRADRPRAREVKQVAKGHPPVILSLMVGRHMDAEYYGQALTPREDPAEAEDEAPQVARRKAPGNGRHRVNDSHRKSR